MKGGRWEKRNADMRAKFARAPKTVAMGYAEMKAHSEMLIVGHLRATVRDWASFPILPPFTITFCWFEMNRHRDPDGVRAAGKFVLDGLVKAGVLAGDTAEYVDGFVDSFVYPPRAIRYECDVLVAREDCNNVLFTLPFRFPDFNEILAARGRDGALTERTRQARRGAR